MNKMSSDECDSNPCGNGGTCNDYVNGFNEFNCTCASEDMMGTLKKVVLWIITCALMICNFGDWWVWFWSMWEWLM